MSAPPRLDLLERVEAWVATLRLARPPRPPRPITLATAEALLADALRPRPTVPALHTVQIGRLRHLVPAYAGHAVCGTPVSHITAATPHQPPTCPGCSLPPEAD